MTARLVPSRHPLTATERADLLTRWAAYVKAAEAYTALDAQGLDADNLTVTRAYHAAQDALDLLEWRVPDAPRLLATVAALDAENARLRAALQVQEAHA